MTMLRGLALTLLALLLVRANQVVSTDRLIDERRGGPVARTAAHVAQEILDRVARAYGWDMLDKPTLR